MADKGNISVREAGRRGGSKVKEKYGLEHYQKIGKIGGTKGGRTTKERHGREHYERIGKMGGARVRELISKAKEMEAQ